jgi:hypothetical protein
MRAFFARVASRHCEADMAAHIARRKTRREHAGPDGNDR